MHPAEMFAFASLSLCVCVCPWLLLCLPMSPLAVVPAVRLRSWCLVQGQCLPHPASVSCWKSRCIPQHCSFTKPCQGRRQQGGPVPGSPTPLHLQAEACRAPLPGPTIACWGNTAGGLIPKPGFHVECGCRQGKCNFGGRHGRNNAAGWRLRGCRAQNLQLL